MYIAQLIYERDYKIEGLNILLHLKLFKYGLCDDSLRVDAKKSSFLSGQATKAFTPPPRLSGYRNFFFRLKIAGNGF